MIVIPLINVTHKRAHKVLELWKKEKIRGILKKRAYFLLLFSFFYNNITLLLPWFLLIWCHALLSLLYYDVTSLCVVPWHAWQYRDILFAAIHKRFQCVLCYNIYWNIYYTYYDQITRNILYKCSYMLSKLFSNTLNL